MVYHFHSYQSKKIQKDLTEECNHFQIENVEKQLVTQ